MTSFGGNEAPVDESGSHYPQLVKMARGVVKEMYRIMLSRYWGIGRSAAEMGDKPGQRSAVKRFAKDLGLDVETVKVAFELYRRFPTTEDLEWAVEHRMLPSIMRNYLRGFRLRDIPRELLKRLRTTDEEVDGMDDAALADTEPLNCDDGQLQCSREG